VPSIVFTVFAEGEPYAGRRPDHVWIKGDDVDTFISSTECANDRAILTTSEVEDFTGFFGTADHGFGHQNPWKGFADLHLMTTREDGGGPLTCR
jgi:hypothetical protein